MSDPNNTSSDELPNDMGEVDTAIDTELETPEPEASLSQSELLAEIESLKDELAQAKEHVLRANAEAQNARRRAEQDVEKAHKFGLEKFVNDLIPVADNLERAVEVTVDQNGDFKAVAEGVELTLKTMLDALKRHSVAPVNPEGEPFDPQLHQAMSMLEQEDVEPNTVLTVFQKGYTLHGRLVRPAMVVVSKAPANTESAS